MSSFSAVRGAKSLLVGHLGLSADALHIHIALVLFFGSALLFGWRLSGRRPWLLVLVAAIASELWTLRGAFFHPTRIDLGADLHDLLNMLFWPTAIMLLARYTRALRR